MRPPFHSEFFSPSFLPNDTWRVKRRWWRCDWGRQTAWLPWLNSGRGSLSWRYRCMCVCARYLNTPTRTGTLTLLCKRVFRRRKGWSRASWTTPTPDSTSTSYGTRSLSSRMRFALNITHAHTTHGAFTRIRLHRPECGDVICCR